MDQKTTYKLNEAKQQGRLEDFQGDITSSDLSDSIALVKTLIESATNAGQSVLVKDLLNTLANLTKAHRIEQVRAGELLNKQSVRDIGRALAEIVADEFDGVPEFELRMDRVIERFTDQIAAAKNEEAA